MHRARPARARRAFVALVGVMTVTGAACQPVALGPLPSLGRLPATSASPTVTPADAGSPGASSSAAPAAPAARAAVTVLDGLAAFASDPERTYRASFTGESRHTTDTLKVKGTLDVSGDDAAIGATFRFPREGSARTDYRLVGGHDWLRTDEGAWRRLKTPAPEIVLDPFAGTHDGTRVQYMGPVDGEDGLHQVELTAMYLHPALIPAGNLTAERISSTKLRLVTDADGIPVRGTWTMRGKGRVSGQLQAIAIELDLTFSKVGEPLTIKEP
jgi:hypothetical protein